ncbi:metallophosphoesterase [Coraliomargarita akajimensis]|uniref:Metallophosphoesterase n=1 Tax=Coraliomargarita akajimensis (strain DSM 45221 / IAM 15411 / JCM 23193 / KCTC 12865 / 04OKA010-24) TaxID=583355 RepID=D5EIC6_CORAD|nr:metallophosphoesterase [Coraliomargarita akajimensis]ADE54192.1 metallophosphoesterase [Coraliomargarita akajimensis DSM 45221]
MRKVETEVCYDIIGDIHGHADALEALLEALGYVYERGAYRHPEGRRAIFVGDFIDRGPEIPRCLEIVQAMWYHDTALAVLGNHEVNALAYHSLGADGKPLRAHTERARKQHAGTLEQFADSPLDWQRALAWFELLPVFLELDGLIVVHAAWDRRLPYFLPGGRVNREMLADMQGQRVSPAAKLLKRAVAGQEVKLPEGSCFTDSKGVEHPDIRVAWWKNLHGATYAGALFPPGGVAPKVRIGGFHGVETGRYHKQQKPVFFGHYWLNPEVHTLAPVESNICCVDYSVARDGILVAYRWDGEQVLSADKFVTVDSKATPSKRAKLKKPDFSDTGEVMRRRPKEYPCSFHEAYTAGEYASGMRYWQEGAVQGEPDPELLKSYSLEGYDENMTSARAVAEEWLGGALKVAKLIDNADCDKKQREGCWGHKTHQDAWRIYYEHIDEHLMAARSERPFLLVDKGTLEVLGRGIERGD